MRSFFFVLGCSFFFVSGCSSESPSSSSGCEAVTSDRCASEGAPCTTPFEGRGGLCVSQDCALVCCAGCVFDGACMPGTTDDACGFAGHDCAPCAAPKSCNYEGICE